MFLADATLEHLRSVAAWPELTGNRYAILDEIGRGGMGSVYAAMDTALGRDVAIKTINAVPSSDLRARLADEARVVARLEHPGIVPVHDFGELADGRPFYVMKRVKGRTLRAHLESDPPLSDRLRIFERICEAVAFAHAQGVIHRDLKPDNVMIGDFGEVLVADWGVATHLNIRSSIDSGGGAPAVVGTRGYMAPEQAAGGAADHRADIFSLGVMLSALLPEHAPRPLRSIAAKASADAAADRYSDVPALRDDVARFREGLAVTAHRETLAERAARFYRTYQLPIVLVLAYIAMRALVALAFS